MMMALGSSTQRLRLMKVKLEISCFSREYILVEVDVPEDTPEHELEDMGKEMFKNDEFGDSEWQQDCDYVPEFGSVNVLRKS